MAITVFLDDDEITGEVYAANIDVGRSLESEEFRPGGGVIRVRNYAANFNPYFLVSTDALLLESGDFLLLESGDKLLLETGNGTGGGSYGEIKLGRRLRVLDGEAVVFTGFVEDIDFEYVPGGFAEAILTVRDSLATLGTTDLLEWSTTAQLTGARVSALLNRSEVGFPNAEGSRSIATGTQPLGTETIRFGTNALQELQRINRAEFGRLFISRTGTLTFQDRYAVFGVTPTLGFDDTDTDTPFHGIDIRFGTELLHFSVSVTRAGGDTEQTAENSDLISEYAALGVRNLTVPEMPYLSDDHAYGLAEFLLARFAQFKAVISGLTVKLGALSSVQREAVCELDIGDVVSVSWTPPGTTGQVSQVLAIEARTYSVSGGDAAAAELSFQLSDASDPDYFQVDTDAVDGPKFVAP